MHSHPARGWTWSAGVLPLLAATLLASAGCCCPRTRPACAPPCGGAQASVAVVQVESTPTAAPTAQVGTPADYDALLRKYVKGEFIDYAGWKKNPADLARLERFLAWQAQADPKAMSRNDAIAFWINAYNSLNIKMILDAYPVHAPVDVPGYFDKIKHRVGGESLTVSEAEYDRLIAIYQDMRAHFAVVCSDRGCLPIRNSAWIGSTLDADLDAAARRFVADERHFKVDRAKKEVWISKIFEWYGEKFTKDPVRPAAKPELFLLPYVDAATRKLLESGDYTLKIIEWSWTLNEKHGS
jgi:Protein of unknown function, DUF547